MKVELVKLKAETESVNKQMGRLQKEHDDQNKQAEDKPKVNME